MKTKFVLITVMLCACHCAGQSNVVYYGTNASPISLAFADTNLSESAKSAITADLRVCLSEWGKATQFRLGADDPAFVAHLHNPDITPYYPETIDFPDNVVSSGAAGLALHIPKKLSDAYTNAFAFAAANSNIVAAAYEFVAFVSSTNFLSVTSNQIANYFLFNQATPQLYQLAFHDLTNSVHGSSYYPPSVLGFHYSPEGPAPTNLWLYIPSSSPVCGYIEWGPVTAIWHDGKWKFSIWEKNPHYELPQ
ncbi:MAG: hypothetical protein PHG74_10565 [Kiritimatiellae bacterium]|jgi:hypothetical protein|nr:hypothetical protein [Kiritimatiellia bacterium]